MVSTLNAMPWPWAGRLRNSSLRLSYNGEQEYERRFKVWVDNLEYAHAHNEQEKSYWVRSCSFPFLLLRCSVATQRGAAKRS